MTKIQSVKGEICHIWEKVVEKETKGKKTLPNANPFISYFKPLTFLRASLDSIVLDMPLAVSLGMNSSCHYYHVNSGRDVFTR